VESRGDEAYAERPAICNADLGRFNVLRDEGRKSHLNFFQTGESNMLATKFNLQTKFGATRREAVRYHKEVGDQNTEIAVDRLNTIKSQRPKPKSK
jgi:hypothetical protein